MLDYFGIFSRGGALLWTLQFTALKHSPLEALNALIRTCLLEERSATGNFTYVPKAGAQQTLKWTYHNGLGIIFVAVYQKSLSLLYVDELLEGVKEAFVPLYKPNLYKYKNFDDTFNQLLRECEARADDLKRSFISRSPVPAMSKQQNGVQAKGMDFSLKSDEDAEDGADINSDGKNEREQDVLKQPTSDETEMDVHAFDVNKLKGAAGKGARGRGKGRAAVPDKTAKKKTEESAPRKKEMRNWNAGRGKGSAEKLDFSLDDEQKVDAPAAAMAGESLMDAEEDSTAESDDEVEAAAAAAATAAAAHKKDGSAPAAEPQRGLLASFLSKLALNVVGSAALSKDDLAPCLVDMKRKLMERNVAEEVAAAVCESVGTSMEGTKLSSFTGVAAVVRRAFEDALSGILNKRPVDVLLDVQKAKERGKPYVIVFCGVNGVGKSTNLAKIAYWLVQHKFKVMIAACDTFRSGAVEQLKTHATRLGVALYERGYEKDPARVAAEAVKQAARDGTDVVLVDTAGRMQDNEPLMRALSNLIHINSPNLVLFVGEALVGNDAVDQLAKFSRALYDLAPTGSTRRTYIDGIVLTKFDTIDDKVGAAVSMVYTSGAPIMFVGCGQTYLDLKRLQVRSVVRCLLK